jgi:phenylalanyl-tRNA synthetase beta chain
MQVPLSWLKEFVEIDIPVELLAERLTLAGLEVGALTYIGVPQQTVPGVRWPKSDHLVWDREKLVLGAIREVKPHPNADRLVMAMVDYGGAELEQTVTGAPNLFEYKGLGPLPEPLWTAFAKEGAEVWDGHSDEPKRMILKEKPLRGVPNRCMVCSDKELGISGEHEGIMLLENDRKLPPGTPMQDVLGDVILSVELTPNLARCFSILGVAREVAALLDKPLKQPDYTVKQEGASILDQIAVEIQVPQLNPRFTLMLLRGIQIGPSPAWMQRRLRAVGQRPINHIVDVTNYVMFEMGQPLHAFDYDKLKARAGKAIPKLTTRTARPGEILKTLDGSERNLAEVDIVITDNQDEAISLAAIMGGFDTEIGDETTTVLLEAANWNFISVRRTAQVQKLFSEASTRFSRGVHPSQSLLGVRRGIELMRQITGGEVAKDTVDVYPVPAPMVEVDLPVSEITRLLGIEFTVKEAAKLLEQQHFTVRINGDNLKVIVPDYRQDISSDPVIGQADLVEEIARIYGYDRIPDTIMEDAMPSQWANTALEREEVVRDVLVALGLRENISYRLTTPEREALLLSNGATTFPYVGSVRGDGYVRIANPITPERSAMRQSVLASVLDNALANARYTSQQQTFEIGSVYLQRADAVLPDEPRRLAILMSGPRATADWLLPGERADEMLDFYDLKGIIEGLLRGLQLDGFSFSRSTHPSLHPGRAATVTVGGKVIGDFGEMHPAVARNYEWTQAPLFVADLDLEALLSLIDPLWPVEVLPTTPPVLQDIALVVPEATEAAAVEAVIRKTGGKLLRKVTLFDVYRGSSIGEGEKSLAYSLVYQAEDRTLKDDEVASVHKKIVKMCERELGAKLRS